jgi:tripeptidyl-peptidase-1
MLQHALLTAALAALGQCASSVFESVPAKPEGWTRVGDASPDQRLRLRIAMQQPNEELLERTLYEVSDPAHANYGQHLSREALADMMAPRAESTEAVRSWLRGAGIGDAQVHDDGEWINLSVTVREASELLEADFGVWARDDDASATRVRALEYSVPDEVAEHIKMVAPVVRFGEVRALRSQVMEVVGAQRQFQAAAAIPPQVLDVAACNDSITPECIRSLYNVGSYQADPSVPNSLFGVSGFLEQWAKYDQLALFTAAHAPYAADANFTSVGINGGVNLQVIAADPNDDDEAALDIQYAVALSYKMPITYYSTAGRGPLIPDLE